ncbi:MAG: peptidylprolyl isomerase [Zetaproteobacteria bacterium]|nr:MAG: peptidylprolyl isomerase [Zetaproteobacteria bacterium]
MLRGTISIKPCILLAMLAACQPQEQAATNSPASTTPVVATIGDKIFHEADIDAEIATLPEHFQSLRNDARIRARVLKSMLRRYALSMQALKMHLNQDPMVKHRILRARNDILIATLQQWQLGRQPKLSEDQIKQYYAKYQDQFTIPEQVHARHILVSSQKKAKEMIRLLRHGKDFAALAAEHSIDDSNKGRGGDLNWFPRGVMVKPFEDAVFALKKPGDISKPVKTQFGWHVIELLGKRPATHQSLEEARENIMGVLRHQALSTWIDGIVKKSGSRIVNPEYQTALSATTPTPQIPAQ